MNKKSMASDDRCPAWIACGYLLRSFLWMLCIRRAGKKMKSRPI